MTAPKSAEAAVVLKGVALFPMIRRVPAESNSGISNGSKAAVVSLCHTPPSASCMVSNHSRFHRISFRMSGVPLPDSGIFRFIPPIRLAYHS